MVETYAVEIIGQKEPTYLLATDVAKLVHATNAGVKLIYVGGDFISPSSIARIRRAYNVDVSIINSPSEDMVELLEGKEIKKLN